jgi:hypothetical protein|tara:strand:- start:1642 stop:2061 length:420 start_codon:yes stop_codon:yes gene_type:complete
MMMKNFIIILICFLFFGCTKEIKIDRNQLTKIDVYYIPFDILSPVESKEGDIKLDIYKKTIIGNDLNEISVLLENLKLDKNNNFNENNVYLRADFFNSDKEILRVLFDKKTFFILGSEYKNDEKLIELLIKKHSWNDTE